MGPARLPPTVMAANTQIAGRLILEPTEYDISPSKEYKELLQLISWNEDKLLATMTDTQKELFTKYADCVRKHQVMAENLLFQNSFRLGARIMLEIMRE